MKIINKPKAAQIFSSPGQAPRRFTHAGAKKSDLEEIFEDYVPDPATDAYLKEAGERIVARALKKTDEEFSLIYGKHYKDYITH